MATVTGLTAARMAASEAAMVTSGAYDAAGHLILTKFDTTQVDAGQAPAATVTLKGVVELATDAETLTGTDTTRAITPANAKSVLDLKLNLTGGTLAGGLNSNRTNYTDVVLGFKKVGDTFDSMRVTTDGKIDLGPGTATRDTNIYRSAANTLKTDDNLIVDLDLTVNGDFLGASNQDMGAWVPYTPAWTSTGTAPQLNNGTIVGRWQRVGRTINFVITLTPGSTTTFGTLVYSFSLPVPVGSNGATFIVPTHWTGSTRWGGQAVLSPGASSFNAFFPAGVADTRLTAMTPAVPATFTSGDAFRVSGSYEAAS